MSEHEHRSVRHHALPQIGVSGQARIEKSTALIVGLGGIGCAVASYLASSGTGHLILNDFDTVDQSNLGRQFLYGPEDVDQLKVDVAAQKLAAMNPDIQLTVISHRLEKDALHTIVKSADVVLDGTDNFATRFMVSDACVDNSRCLISGSTIRFEGQLAVFGPDYAKSCCYRCLYDESDESLQDCSGNGVLAPLPGVIGSLMASEALKYLAEIPLQSANSLLLYDALANQWESLRIVRRKDCPGCARTN